VAVPGDFTKFVSPIVSRTLFCATASRLGDALEGSVPEPTALGRPPERAAVAERLYRDARGHVPVSSEEVVGRASAPGAAFRASRCAGSARRCREDRA
jgi:hypothetical protein